MHVCLVADSLSNSIDAASEYEAGYKALCSLLYSNARLKMSLAMNGCAIAFLKEEHPECLCLLQEMVSRSQIEVIGGGYYDPVFPLLFSRDRTAQIDMLNSAITAQMGHRPHTAMLYASAWDASLVSSFKTNGIECVLLDSSAIEANRCAIHSGIPLVMSDRGKAIDIFEVEREDLSRTFAGHDGEDSVRCIGIAQKDIASYIASGNLAMLCDEAERAGITLSTITDARTAICRRKRSYLVCGLSAAVSCGAQEIHEYLAMHKDSDSLYQRQTWVAILIDQYHGDKVRKKAAREYLLSSQRGDYLFNGSPYPYEMLNEADFAMRDENFADTVTAFDIDGDGNDELVCRMQRHSSVIATGNGEIVAFDSMIGTKLKRYSVQLFRDSFHLHNDSGDIAYPIEDYTMQKFVRCRRELFLAGNVKALSVSVRKKYIITPSGFVVQYIIRNGSESGQDLDAQFAVLFCFWHITEDIKSVSLSGNGVAAVQLTDKDSDVSFMLEPNEDAALKQYGEGMGGTSLSWRIQLKAGMECEKTISLAMTSKGGEHRVQKKRQEQQLLWDED